MPRIPNDRRSKASSMQHGDLYTVRLYTDESMDGHVYDYVKHLWTKTNGTLLCLCQYFDDGTFRFVYWPLSTVRWFQMVPLRFEQDET